MTIRNSSSRTLKIVVVGALIAVAGDRLEARTNRIDPTMSQPFAFTTGNVLMLADAEQGVARLPAVVGSEGNDDTDSHFAFEGSNESGIDHHNQDHDRDDRHELEDHAEHTEHTEHHDRDSDTQSGERSEHPEHDRN